MAISICQSAAISLNENLISNSNFETLDGSQKPIHWETTGNLPNGASAGVESNPGGTYTRTSGALNEDGTQVGSSSARFSSNLAYHAAVSNSSNSALASESRIIKIAFIPRICLWKYLNV